ncbi:hypothetical protein PHLGIDRAFT_122911 [Phlebiopsis gigantea 11061_1 CR5-6]|uniref:Uncharacterized protein n=1 Tax=Phlebiopsis gigantea (strain 11061_1 CR5-6) TaxID=745531 RepID=A0A0C3PAS6_PHLG1|nr:hypothetical protein PHLGIDRAFT_122911 [Phlebiopsis gigantea 11061_1 CR5-6]
MKRVTAKYKPRNHVPWIIIGICYVVCQVVVLARRWLLNHETRKHDAEPVDETYDAVYVTVVDSDGKTVEKKVSKMRSSLCGANHDLCYVL